MAAKPNGKKYGHLRLVHSADAKKEQGGAITRTLSADAAEERAQLLEFLPALTALAKVGEVTGFVCVYRQNGEYHNAFVGDMRDAEQIDAAQRELLRASARLACDE